MNIWKKELFMSQFKELKKLETTDYQNRKVHIQVVMYQIA